MQLLSKRKFHPQSVWKRYVNYTSIEWRDIGKKCKQDRDCRSVSKISKRKTYSKRKYGARLWYKNGEWMKQAAREKRAPKRWRFKNVKQLLLLQKVDKMMQNYLSATRQRRRLVSFVSAKALIKQNSQFNLDHIVIGDSSVKSLFFRTSYVRRIKTTWKRQIPKALQKEPDRIFQTKIPRILDINNISSSMALNLNQAPSEFASSAKTTLAPQGEGSIHNTGSSNKRVIMATFTISHESDFLPLQLIYQGTTVQNFIKVSYTFAIIGFIVVSRLKFMNNKRCNFFLECDLYDEKLWL